MMRPVLSLISLALIVSMAVVFVRHESRKSYQALNGLDEKRDQLNIEYGKLMLERATWSMRENVEQEATEELDMFRPEADQIISLNVRQGAKL